jgi:hypothetical protein
MSVGEIAINTPNYNTGVKLMFVTGVTYIPTWRTRKMVN